MIRWTELNMPVFCHSISPMRFEVRLDYTTYNKTHLPPTTDPVYKAIAMSYKYVRHTSIV